VIARAKANVTSAPWSRASGNDEKNRSGAPVSKTTSAEDGKKYTKVVTNPETGRKNRIRYGAKGYKIAPGTDKRDRYCARSFGDMKSHGKDCAGADRNTPLCLSRAKWRCSRQSQPPRWGYHAGKVRPIANRRPQGRPGQALRCFAHSARIQMQQKHRPFNRSKPQNCC
jgi:hypothetical protein